MESATMNDTKEEHILNKDDSITNKDGDNYLEKGGQSSDQDKPDQKRLDAVIPDNDNGDPESPAEDKPSKKNAETKKYAL